MRKTFLLTVLTAALALPALAGDYILLDDFQGKGAFRHETVQTSGGKDSVQKKGSYLNIVRRGKAFAGMKSVGEKKIDFTKCGSVSVDVRIRKPGEKFDPSRRVCVTLLQWEGGKNHPWYLNQSLEGVPSDGRWYRVTMPMCEAIFTDATPPGRDAVYASVVGVGGDMDIEDLVEVDVDNLVAYPEAPEKTTVTPIDK